MNTLFPSLDCEHNMEPFMDDKVSIIVHKEKCTQNKNNECKCPSLECSKKNIIRSEFIKSILMLDPSRTTIDLKEDKDDDYISYDTLKLVIEFCNFHKGTELPKTLGTVFPESVHDQQDVDFINSVCNVKLFDIKNPLVLALGKLARTSNYLMIEQLNRLIGLKFATMIKLVTADRLESMLAEQEEKDKKEKEKKEEKQETKHDEEYKQ